MPKVTQEGELKTEKERVIDPRAGLTLGEASDISSMTILRRQLEQKDDEEQEPTGGGE